MRVAWLMTDYPKNSQTFNHQEIVSIEKHGVEVVPIALNSPDESDLEQPEHRRALRGSASARPRVGELYDTRKTTLHLLETIQAAAQDSLASGCRRDCDGAPGCEARALAASCLRFSARPCAPRAQQAALRRRR